MAQLAVQPATALDPVTFEVLRHRLWTINDEAAATLRLISGSPVASEVCDYNTALMDAAGDSVYVGVYMVSHAVGQGFIVKHILEHYRDNPGINEDDVFICNDPYSGALHQNDVTCVGPIFWQGRLLAWTGATIHQVDVGGPVKGSQGSVGSRSIYEEAPLVTPLKIVENGVLRKDIEENYLIRSRTRELNALDLRAKLAAINVTKRRIQALAEKYGVEALVQVIDAIINYTETRLRARLLELPDGTWRHTTYIDEYDGKNYRVYPVILAMTKAGDRLTFDFRGTAAQAPAVMNCTYSGLVAGLAVSVLSFLCYDLPWAPAAVERVSNIIVEPGTIINAAWPAGCSKATTAGSPAVTVAVNVCLGKMLLASDKYQDHAMAPWTQTGPSQELFGVDKRGKDFGASLLDGLAGGGGARTYADGMDTSGVFRALAAAVANAETYELRYPILYLYRRQQPDSGGPGKFRGGTGISTMYIPYDVDEIPTNNMHTFGVEQPAAVGLGGGYPGATHLFSILRNSNVREVLASGTIPTEFEEMAGTYEPQPGMSRSYLKRNDVYRLITSGGGGYGDPLDRLPDLVRKDVLNQLVTRASASAIYGVVLTDTPDAAVNVAATAECRAAIRARRLETARKDGNQVAPSTSE